MDYLGTSGWYYAHWADRFYPKGLPKSDWLPYYCTKFNTVEVNASFYRLPSESMVAGWREKTPAGFVFAFKGSRVVTHLKKLKGTSEYLATFYARVGMVGEKLGVVLWQLPPSLRFDLALLEGFLAELRQDIRQVVEFRHDSWFTPETFALLERYHVGLCIVSSPTMPVVVKATAGFAYVRWHGNALLYISNYSHKQLEDWARQIRGLPVQDVFGYFNNDAFAFAPQNCLELKEILKTQCFSVGASPFR
jgi:uncharacterized protein YecE (DUF72 family)